MQSNGRLPVWLGSLLSTRVPEARNRLPPVVVTYKSTRLWAAKGAVGWLFGQRVRREDAAFWGDYIGHGARAGVLAASHRYHVALAVQANAVDAPVEAAPSAASVLAEGVEETILAQRVVFQDRV